jgi:hypothetical protein
MTRVASFGFSLAALAFAFGPAQATTLSGYGAQTCGDWRAAHRDAHSVTGAGSSTQVAADQWVFGYVDALAKFIDSERQLKSLPALDIQAGLDDAAILTLVDRFCGTNPRRSLGDAVGDLSAQLVASGPQLVAGKDRRSR